ncbi:TonB family protein [Sphingomonas qilianensis]|uniref:TonB family protein n=1 Tax=Sphingomonas qilianensis TaxID=1736690 RepID=A0ABU9XU06_9SPHN
MAFSTPALAEKPYFSMLRADYPAAALAAGIEGDVPVTLYIRDDGTIDRCVAEPGGKLALLKRASCAVIAQRGLFAPTLKHGKPVASEAAVIARWRILPVDSYSGGATPISPTDWVSAADLPSSTMDAAGGVVVALDVADTGRPTSCSIEKSSGSAVLDRKICQLALARARYLAAVDDQGRFRATKALFKVKWESGM